MSSIKDFKCTYDNGVLEHSKIVEELGFTFPDVYYMPTRWLRFPKKQKRKTRKFDLCSAFLPYRRRRSYGRNHHTRQ